MLFYLFGKFTALEVLTVGVKYSGTKLAETQQNAMQKGRFELRTIAGEETDYALTEVLREVISMAFLPWESGSKAQGVYLLEELGIKR